MIRVIVRVKDKGQTEHLKELGSIVYRSPILNIIGMEISEKSLEKLRNDYNVVSCEIEPKGRLMVV